MELVRSTRDRLELVWSAVSNVRSWRLVCWDGRDSTVALLTLSSEHRHATIAGLRPLQEPFTIAISGLASDGAVIWQDGLPDLTPRDTGRERREAMPAKKTQKAAAKKAPATGKPRVRRVT